MVEYNNCAYLQILKQPVAQLWEILIAVQDFNSIWNS
jgi:hypothetical protein